MKLLITSALPYANGPLHFGHIAGAYLPADCYARFQRLRGNDVAYLCGSDEYGVAITLNAELAKRTPQEHVDLYHHMNLDFFNRLGISFDHYSRTTWEGHAKTVQEFFLNLLEKGYIEEKTEKHLYSPQEERFLADRYVIGICPKCGFEEARGDECQKCSATYEATDLKEPRSKITRAPLILKPSNHWYLRFDLFKDQLLHWLQDKKWKPNVLRFVKNFISELRPRAITRDSTWGVLVPLSHAKGKVFYVWFDAPIGYISATKEWGEKQGIPELWKEYWLDHKTKLVQFIGKDNIPFHTIFFPAMLMGQKESYILPSDVPANEFLLLEGKKFSKTDQWYIDLDTFFTKYSVDQVRYYLAAIAPETADSEFYWRDFQARCNGELLAKLGNFVHRTLVFAKNHCEGKIPPLPTSKDPFFEWIDELVDAAREAYETFQIRHLTSLLMELAQEGNIYFDHKKPWVLAKEKKKQELFSAIYSCLSCIKALALIASPLIPQTAQKIWELLGFKSVLSLQQWDKVKEQPLEEGQILLTPEVLFKKIEDEQIEKEIAQLHATMLTKRSEIEIKDFEKIEMRIGKIIQAEIVPKSKKLLKLEVDLGTEKRCIVSGIANYYRPEDLLEKKVIVVTNLKPIQLMGIKSHGMILAASLDQELELPMISKLEPGSILS